MCIHRAVHSLPMGQVAPCDCEKRRIEVYRRGENHRKSTLRMSDETDIHKITRIIRQLQSQNSIALKVPMKAPY